MPRKVHVIRPCQTCGIDFQVGHGGSRYCINCRPAAKKAYIREWQQKNPNWKLYLSLWHAAHREARNMALKVNNAKNRYQRKNNKLKKLYGISLMEYDLMKVRQDGCCAICLKRVELLSVDHDHTNGRVRGLLCFRCNRGIGIFSEDISVFFRAIYYLQQFQYDEKIECANIL